VYFSSGKDMSLYSMQRLLHRRWRPGSITITAWQQQGSTIQFVLLHPQIDQPAQALHSHDEQRRTNTSKTSTRPTVIFYLPKIWAR
jgi:hypothetical protein